MKIEKGNKVKVHYVGKLDNGNEFDNSYNREEPLEFIVGDGQLIQGFEDGVVGMEVGEKKEVNLSPDQAYGDRIEEAVSSVDKSNFPPSYIPVVGETVQGRTESGLPIIAVIKEVKEHEIVLDMNHPLAGENLNFKIEVIDINQDS